MKKILKQFIGFLVFISALYLFMDEGKQADDAPKKSVLEHQTAPKPFVVPPLLKRPSYTYTIDEFQNYYWDWIRGAECGPVKDCCVVIDDKPVEVTCFGVNKKYNKSYHKIKELLEGKASQKVLELMAIDTFYTERYINTGIAKLPFLWQLFVLDYAIHSNPRKAIKDFQFVIGAKPDGVIGKTTIQQAEQSIDYSLVERYIDKRHSYMKTLTTKYKKHKNNWTYRLNKLRCNIGKNKLSWRCTNDKVR